MRFEIWDNLSGFKSLGGSTTGFYAACKNSDVRKKREKSLSLLSNW